MAHSVYRHDTSNYTPHYQMNRRWFRSSRNHAFAAVSFYVSYPTVCGWRKSHEKSWRAGWTILPIARCCQDNADPFWSAVMCLG